MEIDQDILQQRMQVNTSQLNQDISELQNSIGL